MLYVVEALLSLVRYGNVKTSVPFCNCTVVAFNKTAGIKKIRNPTERRSEGARRGDPGFFLLTQLLQSGLQHISYMFSDPEVISALPYRAL